MELIASGRDADVYAYADGLVLRRYRDGRPAGEEAELMRWLGCAGYPVPEVHRSSGPDLVMERVEGPTLASAMTTGPLSPADGGTLLADLHDRLHALEHHGVMPLLHLDLHPLNVVLTADGPVVLDWSNARRGPAGLDVALTVLILEQLLITPGTLPSDPALETALRESLGEFFPAFVSSVATPYVDHLGDAEEFRRQDPYQTQDRLNRLGEARERAEELARVHR
ncbi:phosphotransferase [Nocardioides sp. DS6]|uniref:Phosphotransferase n=1 Tax=Nocardioides eburneus TaxID=3231482 RepID=A0ABV3SWS8_9ACTN